MAGTNYIRQSTFSDGDIITAGLFDNEFNQIVNAFAYSTSGITGHNHDGSVGQGGHIPKIGDQDFENKIEVDTVNNRWGFFVEVSGSAAEQLRLEDGIFAPVTDSDVDLGTTSLRFKDFYTDTVTATNNITAGGAVTAASLTVGGVGLTATITELNTLDGITSTVTELNYTDGVTSNIQTQLNAKQPLDAQLTDIASLTPTDGTFIVGDGTNFVAEAPATALASLGVTSTATELNVLDGITVTATELNYVHNVTSPIQTQLNAKQALNAKLTDISNLTLADNFFLVSTGANLALESPATALGSLGVTATATELNYVDGVTSSIQTQINTKAPLAFPTFTGELTAPTINASSSLKIGGAVVGATATELSYTSGVTSSIQAQLDALQTGDTDLAAIAALTPSDSTFIVGNGTSWVAETGATVRTSLGLTIGTDVAPLASPTFTGTVTADGLSLGDNDKATFGNSNDLEIYHDGSHSYISDVGQGDLRISGSSLVDIKCGADVMFRATEGGATQLRYGGSLKLATTSTGIDVTGTATMDGLTVDGGGTLRLNAESTGDFFTIRQAGTGTIITADSDATGRLFFETTAAGTNYTRMEIQEGGDISFYEDTGTTPKFFWDASAESLGIGTTSPQESLHTSGNIRFGDTAPAEIYTNSSELRLGVDRNNDNGASDITFYADNSEKMRIDASGNVGIGLTPTSKLDVDGNISSTSADLKEIATTISDTAVDVFVYDTRKDSDGGAWRKRTQNTSWYNETLNTATRGSRKEFPAVAVIVAENNKVTIYDGDDPDMPMWMVFNGGGSTESTSRLLHLNNTGKLATAISALNGIISVSSLSVGVTIFSMITEISGRSRTTGTYIFNGNITQRNETIGGYLVDSKSIVNDDCNNVAMTVLPNAPIDAATGLPVPTIAVATEGGVSVIKDDGTVVDDTTFSPIDTVEFAIDNDVFYGRNGFGRVYKWDYAADTSSTAQYVSNVTNPPVAGNVTGGIIDFGDDSNWSTGSGTDGINLLVTNTLAVNITSEFNTGWMNGDIKLATLSDTDDTDVTGSELVTGDNSTFTNGIGDWVAFSGATLSHDTDRMQIVSNGTDGYAKLNISGLTSGKQYVLAFDFDAATGTQTAYLGGTSLGGKEYVGTTGTASWTFTYAGETYILVRASSTSGITSYVDNVSIRIAEEDRSVNDNGLQVFGTITKDPVATGADLVAYSGFSTSNYLVQPRNANTEIGTGDAAWIVWAKTTSSAQYEIIVSREGSNFGTAFNIRFEYGVPNFWATNDSFTTFLTLNDSVTRNDGSWHCFVWVKQGTTYSSYADGKQIGSGTYDIDMSDSSNDEVINIGVRGYSLSRQPFNGSIALARFSHTAPTAEQIAKIYEDEKVLFQENSQATLYGSSDSVTALAYDDDTELLHVGTSAGRSVFQGLRRVDNTTDAVGAAISASNGLIAED